eukprot:Selendium_serpulae@DN3774_c0_g1_i1.p1
MCCGAVKLSGVKNQKSFWQYLSRWDETEHEQFIRLMVPIKRHSIFRQPHNSSIVIPSLVKKQPTGISHVFDILRAVNRHVRVYYFLISSVYIGCSHFLRRKLVNATEAVFMFYG